MERKALDDFIQYAKEQFGCDIFLKSCDRPDTFEKIFGTSFLNDDNNMEKVDVFNTDLYYENTSMNGQVIIDSEIGAVYNRNIGQAA